MVAQFSFGNVSHLKDRIYKFVDSNPNLVAIVLDASSINALDPTAVDTYQDIALELRAKNVELFMPHVKGSVLRVMQAVKLTVLDAGTFLRS